MVKSVLTKAEIKWITGLRNKKNRLESGVFVVEGFKMIEELVSSKFIGISKIFGLKELLKNLAAGTDARFELVEVNDSDLARITSLKNHAGILAVVPVQPQGKPDFSPGQWLLALDDIQDPGNMGTIIRLADWFGIETVLATRHCADWHNPKVVQAAMGSVFRTRVYYSDWEEWIANANLPVYGAAMVGENIYALADLQPGILVIGNEGHGIGAYWQNRINRNLTIPRIGGAESLNAAVATGILLSHLIKGK